MGWRSKFTELGSRGIKTRSVPVLSRCEVPGPKSGSVEGGMLLLEAYAKAVEVGIMLTGHQITFAKVDTKWAKPHTTFRERHTTSAEVGVKLREPHALVDHDAFSFRRKWTLFGLN